MPIRPPTSGSLKPGQSLNPAGKPKGTLNKNTELALKLAAMGYDPVQVCINIATDPTLDITVRERANGRLIDRIVPTLRSTEHSISDKTIDDLSGLLTQMRDLTLKFNQDY
jgi:hypothetical protein